MRRSGQVRGTGDASEPGGAAAPLTTGSGRRALAEGGPERSESPERGCCLFPAAAPRCVRGGRRPGEDSSVRRTRGH